MGFFGQRFQSWFVVCWGQGVGIAVLVVGEKRSCLRLISALSNWISSMNMSPPRKNFRISWCPLTFENPSWLTWRNPRVVLLSGDSEDGSVLVMRRFLLQGRWILYPEEFVVGNYYRLLIRRHGVVLKQKIVVRVSEDSSLQSLLGESKSLFLGRYIDKICLISRRSDAGYNFGKVAKNRKDIF